MPARQILPHLALLLLLLHPPLLAQRAVPPEPPHIEVAGRSEVMVVPDEIHIAIGLRERGSGNSKDTVDKQELDLKEAVNGLDIDATDQTLSDATADLVPNTFRDDDVIARKRYMLKVADAEVVRMVFLGSDHLQIKDVGIHHVPRSKEVELRREQRIKAAKEKANYLLEAIGERTGPELKVEETQGIQRLLGVQARQQYNNARLLGGNRSPSFHRTSTPHGPHASHSLRSPSGCRRAAGSPDGSDRRGGRGCLVLGRAALQR